MHTHNNAVSVQARTQGGGGGFGHTVIGLHPRAVCGYCTHALFHTALQSTLRPPEVHIRAIHFNVNARFVWHLMGVNDMHAMHVVLKIVHVYVWM